MKYFIEPSREAIADCNDLFIIYLFGMNIYFGLQMYYINKIYDIFCSTIYAKNIIKLPAFEIT